MHVAVSHTLAHTCIYIQRHVAVCVAYLLHSIEIANCRCCIARNCVWWIADTMLANRHVKAPTHINWSASVCVCVGMCVLVVRRDEFIWKYACLHIYCLWVAKAALMLHSRNMLSLANRQTSKQTLCTHTHTHKWV